MKRKNQIVKQNKTFRNCQDCEKTIEYIPRRPICIDCYKKNIKSVKVKFIDEDDEDTIFNIYND
jgi:uncharacterized OB-fold protein